MKQIEFKGELFKEIDCRLYDDWQNFFELFDNTKVGEFFRYYDKYIIHTNKGFMACYVEDKNNCWYI